MALPGISSSQPLTVPPVVVPRYSDTTVRRVAYSILAVGIIAVGAIGYGLFSLYRRVTRSSNDLLSQGYASFDKADYKQAILKYTEALACNPSDKELHAKILTARGKAYSALASPKEAVKDYAEALECNPTDKELHAEIYYMRGLQYSLLNQNYQAYKDYSAALDLKPSGKDLRAALFNAKGDIYFRVRQYDEAITAYTGALNCNPDNIKLRIKSLKKKILIHHKKKEYDAAIETCNTALSFELPTKTKARFYLMSGNAYRRNKQYEAGQEYKKALECDPTNEIMKAKLLFYQGKAFRVLRKTKDAIEVHERILESSIIKDRLRAKILYSLGNIYASQKDYNQALQTFNSALKCTSECGRAKLLFERAWVHSQLGNAREEKQDLLFALLAFNPFDMEKLNAIENKLKELRTSSQASAQGKEAIEPELINIAARTGLTSSQEEAARVVIDS